MKWENPFPLVEPPVCRRHENCQSFWCRQGLLIVSVIVTTALIAAILSLGLAQAWLY